MEVGRDDVWGWSVQERKLLKPRARTEFLLFKEAISKWISPVLLYPSTTAWLLSLTRQRNAQIHQFQLLQVPLPMDQGSCHPSIHPSPAVGADQHLPGTAPSSWREAVTHSGYPPQKPSSSELCLSPCALQLSARTGLPLASSWQQPLQLCGLHRLHLCLDLALWFWGFSPHDRFPKSVVVVISQAAIKGRVEVKVMLYHKPLKSFFACSAEQTQKATDVLFLGQIHLCCELHLILGSGWKGGTWPALWSLKASHTWTYLIISVQLHGTEKRFFFSSHFIHEVTWK